MAKPKESIDIETPEEKIENRVAVLEAVIAKHLGYHFGGIKPE